VNETTSLRTQTLWRRLSRIDPAKAFAWVGLPLGVLLVALTPPFQVPDEPNHFYRAYQVSDGGLVPQRTADSVGGSLPRSLPRLADSVIGKVPFNPDVKPDLEVWRRAFATPLRPDDRIEATFPNTALTGPIAYLPQAIGIELGKIIGASALVVFYFSRLSSVFLCVALTVLSIRWLPVRRWTCALLSLLPMALFVRSSASSDGPTLALTMLALAACLRQADPGTRAIRPGIQWPLPSVAALMAFGKPPYGAVMFLAFATPPRVLGGMKRYVSTMLVLTTVFVAAQGAWAMALRGRTAVSAPGSDPQAQLTYIADRPVDAAVFLVRDFMRSIPTLAYQAVGVLGWLDAPIPIPAAAFLGLVVVLVALGEPFPPSAVRTFRWPAAVIGLVGALTLHAMNFVWWTPPGAPYVAGIQGRHLLPFVPFLFLALSAPARIARPLTMARPVLVIVFLVVSATVTMFTIVGRYYLDR
jgi:uncharacterized membrane protein